MAVLYNLDPLAAIDIFYHGEKNGIPQGDFIKNERQRNITFPPLLREFLEQYGYFGINQNVNTFSFFRPDIIKPIYLSTDEGEIPILSIGYFDERFIGIRTDIEDFPVSVGREYKNVVEWSPSPLNLLGAITVMFLTVLFDTDEHYSYYTVKPVLEKYGVLQSEILPSNNCPERFSINFDEERKIFIVAEFDGESEEIVCLHTAPLRPFSLEELEQLFSGEFYGNALHCDFEHALKLQTEIITRLEDAQDTDPLEMTNHYKIAARCCWALKRSNEAEMWYQKGLPAVERNLQTNPETAADYYMAMGNFYADMGQDEQSDRCYERSLEIYRLNPDNVRNIGMLYQSRAHYTLESKKDVDLAIELYNKALEEFQKKPKDCKYDIARTQQLRGDAKRLKKELSKSAQE